MSTKSGDMVDDVRPGDMVDIDDTTALYVTGPNDPSCRMTVTQGLSLVIATERHPETTLWLYVIVGSRVGWCSSTHVTWIGPERG